MIETKLQLLELYQILVKTTDEDEQKRIKKIIDDTERRMYNRERVEKDICSNVTKFVEYYKEKNKTDD